MSESYIVVSVFTYSQSLSYIDAHGAQELVYTIV